MTDELLLSIAFPGDTFEKILQETEELDFQKLYESHKRKVVEFYMYSLLLLRNLDEKRRKHINEVFENDICLISPQWLTEYCFNETHITAIVNFLDKYDNAYFWEAFGISLEKGNSFYEKMKSFDENPNVLRDIINEIVNTGKLNKVIVINELLSYITFDWNSNKDLIEYSSLVFTAINEVALKYTSINEALDMIDKNRLFDSFLSVIMQNKVGEEYMRMTPEYLFEFIKIAKFLGDNSSFSDFVNRNLADEDSSKRILQNSFKMHKYGYEAYLVYLSWCEEKKCEPALKVGNSPELYFYNSYKVPQIESLYKRYFSELSEEDAKEKTKKCFEKIYESLKNEGFLDEGCRKEEFLWAFGLTDEYPFAFRKIKFYTLTGKSKRDKGNGAFLCLLTILCYTSEEIKAMLHRNPEKSIINKTFDLTIKDNTIMSKDYDELLKIVKSSGLPI